MTMGEENVLVFDSKMVATCDYMKNEFNCILQKLNLTFLTRIKRHAELIA